jgi:hypothetical protein
MLSYKVYITNPTGVIPVSFLSTPAQLEYYAELGDSLPPPADPAPEHRQRRLTTAVETFKALRPGDAYEARLAVRIVACGAHAIDALREAGVHHGDFSKVTRCRAQAAHMMRQENTAMRRLEQRQKVRLAMEAVARNAPELPAPASAPPPEAEPQALPPQAESKAVAQEAEPQAAPKPVQAAAPPSQPAPATTPMAALAPPVSPRRPAGAKPAADKSAPPPTPEAISKAEAYALEEPLAAAQIRHDCGVTSQNTAFFRHLTLPADPALIDALVRGTSAVLSKLDALGGEDLDTAA